MSQIAGIRTAINRADSLDGLLDQLKRKHRAEKRPDRLKEAAHHGKICGDCGRKLRDGEPVWRERKCTGVFVICGIRFRPTAFAPFCAECRSEDLKAWTFGECETCGRLVYYTERPRGHRRWAFCCDDCQSQHQSAYQAAIARQRRAEARGPSRPCLECGEHFEPTRADAKFCSGRCKQKHYRHALRLANGGHCDAFESRNAVGVRHG
jgi:hypothetical protein